MPEDQPKPKPVQKEFELQAEKKARVFNVTSDAVQKPLPPPSQPVQIKKVQKEQK
mgnify:CR=1 FL=1